MSLGGRPPFCPRDRRVSVDFICTREFKQALIEEARRRGISLSALIRERLGEQSDQ